MIEDCQEGMKYGMQQLGLVHVGGPISSYHHNTQILERDEHQGFDSEAPAPYTVLVFWF